MANTFTAAFAQAPKIATAVCTLVATINNDTPSNTVLLLTAGSNGAIVTRLSAIPRASVTATSLLLFLSSDGGTTRRLIDSEVMPVFTANAGLAVPETFFPLYNSETPLRLASGERLYVGIQVARASGIAFRAEFTNF